MSLVGADLELLLGADAAEDELDERLAAYFLETPTYREVTRVTSKLRVIVGNKGTGKSAIFRMAARGDTAAGRLPIHVRPDDLADVAKGSLNYLQLVAAWKKGLAEVIIEKSLRALGESDAKFLGKTKRATGQMLDVIVKALGDEQKGFKLTAARAEAARTFMTNRELILYVDDLDRGWTGTPADATRYGAMFEAIRDLQRDNPTLRARIGLRTDLYSLIRANDSSSDKWQSAVAHHAWTNHETFVLLVSAWLLTLAVSKTMTSCFGVHNRARRISSAQFLLPALAAGVCGTTRRCTTLLCHSPVADPVIWSFC